MLSLPATPRFFLPSLPPVIEFSPISLDVEELLWDSFFCDVSSTAALTLAESLLPIEEVPSFWSVTSPAAPTLEATLVPKEVPSMARFPDAIPDLPQWVMFQRVSSFVKLEQLVVSSSEHSSILA